MFKKVLEYAGGHRKTTYAAIAAMMAGMVMQVLPFWFIYQIIRPFCRQAYGAWSTFAQNAHGLFYRGQYW